MDLRQPKSPLHVAKLIAKQVVVRELVVQYFVFFTEEQTVTTKTNDQNCLSLDFKFGDVVCFSALMTEPTPKIHEIF